MLHKILTYVIVFLVFIDIVFLAIFLSGWSLMSVKIDAGMIMIFLLIQTPIIYFFVYRAYILPVNVLNQEIAKFMTGMQDDTTIEPSSMSKGMNYLTNFFIKSLKILKAFKQELRDGRKLKSEVEIASDIQRHVFEKEIVTMPFLDVAMATTPATEVGWDSLDIIVGRDDNYYLYIGDVTWHGVPSGFVMMMVNALISAFSLSEQSGAKVLSLTNTILKPRIKQNMMMTCVMLRWDTKAKAMYYTGAGHEFILVYKAKMGKVFKVKTGGVALGMMRDSSKILKEQQIAFDPMDIIVLYTDGISEARYRSEQNGILFTVDRIVEAINRSKEKNARAIFQQITIDLSAFMGYKHKQYDDITLAVVQYLPENIAASTSLDIPDAIDKTNITEWNWWRHTVSST
jgi:serine phosphatase RsbU (regulator of sigma subunit)